MLETVFAFGQRGGYYFECPSQWKFGNLPAAFQALHTQDKIAAVYCAVLGAGESYILSYKGKDARQHLTSSSNIPPSLSEWLYKQDASGTAIRDFKNLRITLGPYNKSFFASDGSSYLWRNLPKALDTALEERRKPGGGWTSAPRIVTLGVGDNYFYLNENEGGAWDLSNYQNVRNLVGKYKKKGDIAVFDNIVLNPYRLQSAIVQFFDGDLVWENIPPNATDAASSIINAMKADFGKRQKRSKWFSISDRISSFGKNKSNSSNS